jgi:hypothetical protein
MKRDKKILQEIGSLLRTEAKSDSLREIYTELVLHYNDEFTPAEKFRFYIDILFKLTFAHDLSFEKIADVIQALAMFDVSESFNLLRILNVLLTADKYSSAADDGDYKHIFELIRGKTSSVENTIRFVDGIILGIFQASNYLDKEFPLNNEYDATLTNVIVSILLHNKAFVHSYKCSKPLSLALIHYCAPEQNLAMRQSRIQVIFTAISNDLESFDPGSFKNPLGAMLLAELEAKFLNSLTVEQKAKIIRLAFSENIIG